MTPRFMELIIDYIRTPSGSDFILLSKTKSVLNAMLDSDWLEEYRCDYSLNMVSNVKSILDNGANKKSVKVFSYLLNKIIIYYSQTDFDNDDNCKLFKLSKDGLILLNMINKDNVSFLDDIY